MRRRFATRLDSSSTTGKSDFTVGEGHGQSRQTDVANVWLDSRARLTVHGHADGDALLEAAQLTLVAGDLVDDAAAIVFAGVGRMEVLLYGPTEETLCEEKTRTRVEVNHGGWVGGWGWGG